MNLADEVRFIFTDEGRATITILTGVWIWFTLTSDSDRSVLHVHIQTTRDLLVLNFIGTATIN